MNIENFKISDIHKQLKYIINMNLLQRCNKRCLYCFNTEFKKKFDVSKLQQLIKYYNNLDITEIQFYGGEPGMLTKNDLNTIFNALSYFQNSNIIYTLYTNGLFFRRYNLADFKIMHKIISFIHITTYNDWKLLNNLNIYDNIQYLMVLNTAEDLKLLSEILCDSQFKNKLYITFPCNFNNITFPEYEFYYKWLKIRNIEKLQYTNYMNQIHYSIFDSLIYSDISYKKFKSLLYLNKKINDVTNSFTKNKIFLTFHE